MKAVAALIRSEPALVLGAVQAILALVVSFGLQLTADQTGAILAAAAAIVALVVRSQVTPNIPPANIPKGGAPSANTPTSISTYPPTPASTGSSTSSPTSPTKEPHS